MKVFPFIQMPVELWCFYGEFYTAVNEQRNAAIALSASEFLKLMRESAIVELDNKLANRSVNEGFSGGEEA